MYKCFLHRCPPGWIQQGDYGCFFFAYDTQGLTWYEADDFCQSLGSHLAEIKDSVILKSLQELARLMPTPASWWVGGNDLKQVRLINLKHKTLVSIFFSKDNFDGKIVVKK